MSSPRKARPVSSSSKAPAHPPAAGMLSSLRPSLPRSAMVRWGVRSVIVCMVVGCLTAVAGWHSAGLVRRGEIDRMLRMSASAPRQAEAEPKTRGKLDRGRLNALVAAAGK